MEQDVKVLTEVSDKPNKQPDLLYIIVDSDRVKIGITGDIHKRLTCLISELRAPGLYVCFCTQVKNARMVEQTCHQKLAQYHLFGEWFSLEPDQAVKLVKLLIGEPL